MEMLDKDKGIKIIDAEDKLSALVDFINDLGKNKNDSLEKLANARDALEDARRTGRNDPELITKINEI